MGTVISYTIATLPGGLKVGMYPFGKTAPKHGSGYFKVFKKTGNVPDPSATLLIEELDTKPPFNSGITERELNLTREWAKQHIEDLRKNWELCKQRNAPNKIEGSTVEAGFFKGLWVREFQFIKDFIVKLKFSNGEIRYVDFSEILEGAGGQVEEIIKNNIFDQAVLRDGTLAWPNGIDFDPDGLYDVSHQSLEDLEKTAASTE